jgi:flagellar hook-length control protein FliK
MQSLMGILTGTGTAESAKQGPLTRLAPVDVPADGAGATFGDLFRTLMPTEEPTVPESIEMALTENDTNVITSQSDSADDPEAPPIAGEGTSPQEAENVDQAKSKHDPASLSQQDEIAAKVMKASQPNIEEGAAVHQTKPLAPSARTDTELRAPILAPARTMVVQPKDPSAAVTRGDAQPETLNTPDAIRPVHQPAPPAQMLPATVQTIRHPWPGLQTPPAMAETEIPLANPATVNVNQPSAAHQKGAVPLAHLANVKVKLEQPNAAHTAETVQPKQAALTPNRAPIVPAAAQLREPSTPAYHEIRQQGIAAAMPKSNAEKAVAQTPIPDRDMPLATHPKTHTPIRPVPERSDFSIHPKTNPAAPTGARPASALTASSTHITANMGAPIATPAQNITVAGLVPDHRRTTTTKTAETEPANRAPLKQMLRGYQAPLNPMPHVSRAVESHRTIESQPTAPMQQQAKIAVRPTAQVSVPPLTEPSATFLTDQRSAHGHMASSSVEFGMAARTDVTAAPNPATPAAAKPELANHIAQQIVDVVKTLPNRPVEISLNPEELGRLKLHLVTSEAGIAVHVSAERPETMDLLRRHIGILDQEFLKLGFEDVAFSFAGGQGPHDQADPSNGQSPEHQAEIADPLAPAETPPAPATLPREGGLDLRL